MGGGNTPSGSITIDDVVKFIHDDMEKNAPPFISEKFPYTTWNDIPDYSDAKTGDYCKTDIIEDEMTFSNIVLLTMTYVIGVKRAVVGPII